MKKILSLLLTLTLVLILCSCGTSPEKTLAGTWKCTDGPESFSLKFNTDGTGLFYIGEESANITWKFTGEKTLEHNETKDRITLYEYELKWDDSFYMITQAGGKEPLMLTMDNYTLLYEKK